MSTYTFELKLTSARTASVKRFRSTVPLATLDDRTAITNRIGVNFRLLYCDLPLLRRAMKRAARKSRNEHQRGIETFDTDEGHTIEIVATKVSD